MPSCPVCSVLRKKKGVFARSPLQDPGIIRSFHVSCIFLWKPLRYFRFLRSDPSQAHFQI
jgi:hypothetical protein